MNFGHTAKIYTLCEIWYSLTKRKLELRH